MAKSKSSSVKTIRKSTRIPSPIKQPSRSISPAAKILLAARSGGRCEFAGCNEYLFEHPLTLKDGNFSQHAHIVAFSEEGPRGHEGERPRDINSVDNLMLLCPLCHKLIDDNPDDYPRAVLEKYKQDHEERIRHVTGLGPDMRTSVVQLKATIGGSAVDIPAAHIYEAVAPRYPTDKKGHVIDLTAYGQENRDEYYRLATTKIQQDVARLYAPGMDVEATRHISLFALAPIPLLAFLGHCLSNKIAVEFYQRHRTGTELWKWKVGGVPARYKLCKRREGRDPKEVALLLCLSGTIDDQLLPSSIDCQFTIYEITLDGDVPNPEFLRQRADLEEFRSTYRRFLAELIRDHPAVRELHVFPAVPAPIAVSCGHDLLPKVHPSLSVYDYDKGSGGFINRLRINDHDTK
jgi:SMODS-associated and fused to various effectors sensor domain/HNH endonuclease